jgi:hypothetical protein
MTGGVVDGPKEKTAPLCRQEKRAGRRKGEGKRDTSLRSE